LREKQKSKTAENQIKNQKSTRQKTQYTIGTIILKWMIMMKIVEAEIGAEAPRERGARVRGKNGRTKDIKRVDIDDVMMKAMKMRARLLYHRIIHLHLPITDITRKSANGAKIRRRRSTKERKRGSTEDTKAVETIIAEVDHHLHQIPHQ
jgi:hypothetical protein